MDDEASRQAMNGDRHEEALSRSVEELQRIVREHEEALSRVRFTCLPALPQPQPWSLIP